MSVDVCGGGLLPLQLDGFSRSESLPIRIIAIESFRCGDAIRATYGAVAELVARVAMVSVAEDGELGDADADEAGCEFGAAVVSMIISYVTIRVEGERERERERGMEGIRTPTTRSGSKTT